MSGLTRALNERAKSNNLHYHNRINQNCKAFVSLFYKLNKYSGFIDSNDDNKHFLRLSAAAVAPLLFEEKDCIHGVVEYYAVVGYTFPNTDNTVTNTSMTDFYDSSRLTTKLLAALMVLSPVSNTLARLATSPSITRDILSDIKLLINGLINDNNYHPKPCISHVLSKKLVVVKTAYGVVHKIESNAYVATSRVMDGELIHFIPYTACVHEMLFGTPGRLLVMVGNKESVDNNLLISTLKLYHSPCFLLTSGNTKEADEWRRSLYRICKDVVVTEKPLAKLNYNQSI